MMTNNQHQTSPKNLSQNLSQEFIAFSIQKQVLKFGEFKTKAGRLSPYFF